MLKAVKFTLDIRSYGDDKVDERKTFMRKVKECELKLTMLIVEHNLPIFLMDHLPKLLASAAPDSEILKTISCARTKVTAIIHNFKEESEANISAILKGTRFSVIIDETTDISVKKCLAILVRYTDIRAEAVRDHIWK
ncbi:hat family dimerization domaincontaining protein-related [Holotrichia oblita]|uniref:Hat family dimerization domaincontaining protein-related n=1 Tax=Holotrichia oblita TaxID=644536 RepID=A0ACB9SL89_HOLOL|nr:hat family dimerization domaincontaining protein-related [Holotrichia oblita]KAI4455361.1 hat family dimerization domaincontaining protein-related [Holotrichia oblita]